VRRVPGTHQPFRDDEAMTDDIGYRVAAGLAITVWLVFRALRLTAEGQGRSHSRFGWARRGVSLAAELLLVLVGTYCALALWYVWGGTGVFRGAKAVVLGLIVLAGFVVIVAFSTPRSRSPEESGAGGDRRFPWGAVAIGLVIALMVLFALTVAFVIYVANRLSY